MIKLKIKQLFVMDLSSLLNRLRTAKQVEKNS